MKIFLLILLMIGFTACTTKENFVLFNQTKQLQVESKEQTQIQKQTQKDTLKKLENVEF
ncbi:hypothetical protein MNB_SV-13-1585 [hydrothermal vent metagenome]|uniref:Lipoprotein n=1 Tax=hydrothermal vent metagenome TaxID=652676 RepID=A0A1W1CYX7_9ZZZZ